MKTTLPTLTMSGWLTDRQLIIGKLIDYFKTSLYTQTTQWYNKISSLPYLLKEYGGDTDRLETETIDTLKNMYLRYFDTVNVSVNITKDEKTGVYKMDIDIDATYDNKNYSLSKTLDIHDPNNIEEIYEDYYN